ncbi:MAG: PAS domain-containing protein, partial [Verrucomicrobia bacterium]|nr:PAS domain-containing protein [Verrucomicrobiota bacterium]
MKPKTKPMPKRSRPSRPPKAAEFRETRVPKAPGALRRAAEVRLSEKSATRPPKTEGDPARLQHDLRIHEIELEMQNQELRQTQVQLETALEQYTELYDFAPAGYLTLGPDGSISRANLTAAGLLGIDRSQLLHVRFGVFVTAEDRPAFANLLARALESITPEAGEVRLSLAGKPPLTVKLRACVAGDGQNCQVVLLDITERRRLEEERELTLHLLDRINSCPNLRGLIQAVTLLLQGATGCEAVGIRLRDGEDFPYFQTVGFPPSFVQAENTLCAVDPQGQVVRDLQGHPVMECMCGNVLRGRSDPAKPGFTARGSFWTNSLTDLLAGTTKADRLACPRNRCFSEGYESVALVRLRTGDETFGLLQFNDKRRGRFTPAKLAHLEQIADHLAVALARWQAEAALQQSEVFAKSVLNALTSHIAVVEEQGTIVAVNDAWRHFARENGGTDPAVHVGANYLAACQASFQREPDPVIEAVLQGLRAVMSGARKEFSVEYPCHSPQEQRWFTVRGTRFPGQGPVRV